MWNEFVILSFAHIIAVASPGADFAVVTKNTLQSGKKQGIYTALGVGLGISVHLIYTLLGIALLLTQSPFLFNLVKIIGAFYLAWIGWQAFQSRASQIEVNSSSHFELTPFRALKQGFLTNVFNPKVTTFFLALYTTTISPETPLTIQSLYGLWLVGWTMLWFALVAWFFSRAKVLAWYKRSGHYVDWAMGAFLWFIAIKLFVEVGNSLI